MDPSAHGRIRRDPFPPCLKYSSYFDPAVSPLSLSQLPVPASFPTGYSSLPIPFSSGCSPPLISVFDMPFSISQPRASLPISFSGILDSFIVLISARIFVFVLAFTLFLSYPSSLFSPPSALAYPLRPVSSSTSPEIKRSSHLRRRFEDHDGITTNGPRSLEFVAIGTSSLPHRPRKPNILHEGESDILKVQVDWNGDRPIVIDSSSSRDDSVVLSTTSRSLSILSRSPLQEIEPVPPATFMYSSSSPSDSGATSAVHIPRSSEYIILGASPTPRRFHEPGDILSSWSPSFPEDIWSGMVFFSDFL